MNSILIGAQGSGKGTQAAMLAPVLGVCHIASGDLFRKVLHEKTSLGRKVAAYLERGELVPDDLTLALVMEQVASASCRGGVLLDGFPRTLAQAQALDENLQSMGEQIDRAIYLEVPREKLFARLSGRLICHAQQHVYNSATRPPKIPGICDIDGSKLYQRSDDRGEAIQKRLDIFFNQTIHLLDHYEAQHKLLTINGDQDIDTVHMDMLFSVNSLIGFGNTQDYRGRGNCAL